jgi:NADPH-dependent 2,4-dienoyl-CoA reductase/sulfur reductase-like enzyme
LKTLLVDEQPGPGGQIYRNITQAAPSVAALLGADYRYGESLAQRLASADVEVALGAVVWDVSRELEMSFHREGRSRRVRAHQLVAATGAMERSSPIPGWTLPGVLNAGAAQIALKAANAVPSGRVVVAGCGPLLLLVACQLLDAGASVEAVVETSPAGNRWRALRHLPSALAAPSYLVKGTKMLRRLRASAVAMFSAADALRVEGDGRVQALCFRASGKEHRVPAEVVLLHHGVVPNTQLTRSLRVDHDWDDVQLAWRPRVDAWGETSLHGLRVAGDGAGIAGARAAEPSGALAALGAAHALSKLDGNELATRSRPAQRELARQLRVRPFLDVLYRPPEWLATPPDGTMVCRCEEVSAGRIREMAKLGCVGPNQTKFFSRCGMGPCQGRVCGLAVTQLLAAELGRSPQEVGAYRIRSPLKPVPLRSIAALADEAGETTQLEST